MKKYILLMSLIVSCATLVAQEKSSRTSVEILQSSSLKITGDTNISDFVCNFDMDLLQEKHDFLIAERVAGIQFLNAVLKLDVKGFDCGSRPINRDFKELIKADQYPQIQLELKQVHIDNPQKPLALVEIRIAGISKAYTIPVNLHKGGIMRLQGKLHLDIKDFDLHPPKKLFGMIVVKDDIEISFDLRIK